MALKRRVEKSYSVDEMMLIINKDFIEKGSVIGNHEAKHYIIGNTCFSDDSEKWLVADLRYNNDEIPDDLLPTYYGFTMEEAVTKCFVDRFNRAKAEEDIMIQGSPSVTRNVYHPVPQSPNIQNISKRGLTRTELKNNQ